MILEYTYTNYAWDFVQEKFLFNIDSKEVFHNKINNSNGDKKLNLIGYIEQNEIIEITTFVNRVNFSNVQLNSKQGCFDAGVYQYNIILNQNTKILLGERGDNVLESNDINVINLINLINKYVGLARELVKK